MTKMMVGESSGSLTGVLALTSPRDLDTSFDLATPPMEIPLPPPTSSQTSGRAQLRIGLIDGYRFSQECMVRALAGASAFLEVEPFDTVADYLAATDQRFDLLVYYSHATASWDAATQQDIVALQKGAGRPPLIVMSDIGEAQQSAALRGAMGCGARGFIPSRTTGMPITLAVIRFVWAGGVYAPLDLLLEPAAAAAKPEPAPAETKAEPADAEPACNGRFTARQRQVLALLRQGKANKAIAHELAMSESTVKVHVRNIMRLTGATNRTQAAYNVKGWDGSAQLG
jgi:DNA-binding NarL/FixJ family response regulator